MKYLKRAMTVVLAAVVVVSGTQPAHAVDLAGSGASFVVPLVEACKAGFAKKTGHSFVYTSTGS
jgi:phosphate transport system substrate-binding protein